MCVCVCLCMCLAVNASLNLNYCEEKSVNPLFIENVTQLLLRLAYRVSYVSVSVCLCVSMCVYLEEGVIHNTLAALDGIATAT